MHRLSIIVAVVIITVAQLDRTARGETEVVASQALTIQPTGPRQGEAGKNYFNVEGTENEKFASFGCSSLNCRRTFRGRN